MKHSQHPQSPLVRFSYSKRRSFWTRFDNTLSGLVLFTLALVVAFWAIGKAAKAGETSFAGLQTAAHVEQLDPMLADDGLDTTPKDEKIWLHQTAAICIGLTCVGLPIGILLIPVIACRCAGGRKWDAHQKGGRQ